MNFRIPLLPLTSSSIIAAFAVMFLPIGSIAQEPQDDAPVIIAPASAVTGPADSTGTADSTVEAVVQDKVGPEEMVREFKRLAPPEQREAGLIALAEFEASASEFAKKILEMRRQHTLLVNSLSDDRALYRKLRNEARGLMNQTYRKSLRLIQDMPHPYAMRFISTVLQQHYNNDIYDKETLEGAARLLDYQVRVRFVALLAARTGMCVGDFDLSKRVYENFKDEDLEERDRGLIGTAADIEKQFAIEQKLLESDPDDLPKVHFVTTRGEFTVELYINSAPSTVSHFIQLAESGFYDGLDFFQVIDGLLALTGDPLGDGSSAPDKNLTDEHGREGSRMPLYGSLVMAKLPIPGTQNFVPNTAGTQFAILFLPIPRITQQQTVFGRVIDGFDVVGSLRRVDPNKKKKKNEIVVPPDRIIECEVLNRPDKLPEVIYAVPTAPMAPFAPAAQ